VFLDFLESCNTFRLFLSLEAEPRLTLLLPPSQGELLAHILNGVINKPVRDALLVHHALSLSKSDSIRTELLISRLVRYHWDRPHMEAVKREYRNRYGVDMQSAVREGTRGGWGAFCEGLCVRRMGDEVREVGRVGGGGYSSDRR